MQKQIIRHGAVFGLVIGLAACGGDDGGTKPEADAGQSARVDSSVAPSGDARVAADTGTADAATSDDAGADDAGTPGCAAFVMPTGVDCSAPSDGVLPKDLRCTGLYGDFDSKQPACGLLEYAPAYTLWSDGAEKRRWASIPAGSKVDASDVDNFKFPVGTSFWKEFRVKAGDGSERLAETRLIRKTADGWIYTSYVWNEAQTEAAQMDNALGATNLYGTGHDVPTRDQCKDCHGGRADFVLGWDALMLGPGATGVTREQLVSLGLVAADSQLNLTIPGNAVEVAALGYLHANCGISCHNQNSGSKGFQSGLFLKLEKNELASVATTDAYTSGVNKTPSDNAKLEGLPTIQGPWVDIRPGDPARSLLVAREKLRGYQGQMPLLGTNQVDDAGVQAVSAWVASMSPDAGVAKPAN